MARKSYKGNTASFWANKALYNAQARADGYEARGDHDKALRVLRRGMTTAHRWLEGTHEKLS